MRRALAFILPLLVLSAASFAQDDPAESADSESGASDFLKELKAAAEPETPPASEPVETGSLKDDDEEEDDGDDAEVRPPAPSKSGQPRDRQARNKMIFRCTAIGLDVLGAGVFAYGLYENSNVTKYTKEVTKNGTTTKYYENIPAAEKAATRRNAAYIIGSVILASGITIHILF